MKKQKELYYSKKPMVVYESNVSYFLSKVFKNYSREEVASEFKLKGKTCLDIACGDGELINKFLYKDYKSAYGIDISKELIKKANSKKSKNCKFTVCDVNAFVENAIKNNKKYDTVYLLAILEHIEWPSIFIKNVYKILNRGGHVIIEVPNVAWLPHRMSMLFGNFPITAPTTGVIPGVYDEHIRFFTFETLKRMITKAGFKIKKVETSGKFRSIKKMYPQLLSPDFVVLLKK